MSAKRATANSLLSAELYGNRITTWRPTRSSGNQGGSKVGISGSEGGRGRAGSSKRWGARSTQEKAAGTRKGGQRRSRLPRRQSKTWRKKSRMPRRRAGLRGKSQLRSKLQKLGLSIPRPRRKLWRAESKLSRLRPTALRMSGSSPPRRSTAARFRGSESTDDGATALPSGSCRGQTTRISAASKIRVRRTDGASVRAEVDR